MKIRILNSLKPDNFAVVMQEVRQIAQMMGKTL